MEEHQEEMFPLTPDEKANQVKKKLLEVRRDIAALLVKIDKHSETIEDLNLAMSGLEAKIDALKDAQGKCHGLSKR